MNIGKALETAMRMANLNQTELANRMGVTPQAVQQWVSGLTSPKGKRLQLLAKILKVDIDFILRNDDSPALKFDDSIEPAAGHKGQVPLISWVQAGEWKDIEVRQGDSETMIDTTVQVREKTFALRVRGDSMSPLFPEGAIIIVEPDMLYQHGDFVIAKNGDDEATFKQLQKDGGIYYLVPLNNRYPIKQLDDPDVQIIGVVREMINRFR